MVLTPDSEFLRLFNRGPDAASSANGPIDPVSIGPYRRPPVSTNACTGARGRARARARGDPPAPAEAPSDPRSRTRAVPAPLQLRPEPEPPAPATETPASGG